MATHIRILMTMSLCLASICGCSDTGEGDEGEASGESDVSASDTLNPDITPVSDGDQTPVPDSEGIQLSDVAQEDVSAPEDTIEDVGSSEVVEDIGDEPPPDLIEVEDEVSAPEDVATEEDAPSAEPDVAEDATESNDSVVADVIWDVGPTEDVGGEADTAEPPPVDIWEADAGGEELNCEELIEENFALPENSGCSDGTREGFLHLASYPNLSACGGAWDIPGIHNVDPACSRDSGNDGVNPLGLGCNVTDLCAEGWHVCLGKDDVLAHNSTGCDGIMNCAESPAFFVVRTSSIGAFYCAPDTIGDPASQNDLFGCGDLGCPTKPYVCEGTLTPNSQTKCVQGEPCTNCASGQECLDGSDCIEGPCYPLGLGSHDFCKSLKNKPTSNCQCYFAGELPPTNSKYVEGDMETVVCEPGSSGCGWCKPLDYWNKKLGVTLADNWDCGSQSTQEALNVVKTDPYTQGGVLCCKSFE